MSRSGRVRFTASRALSPVSWYSTSNPSLRNCSPRNVRKGRTSSAMIARRRLGPPSTAAGPAAAFGFSTISLPHDGHFTRTGAVSGMLTAALNFDPHCLQVSSIRGQKILQIQQYGQRFVVAEDTTHGFVVLAGIRNRLRLDGRGRDFDDAMNAVDHEAEVFAVQVRNDDAGVGIGAGFRWM